MAQAHRAPAAPAPAAAHAHGRVRDAGRHRRARPGVRASPQHRAARYVDVSFTPPTFHYTRLSRTHRRLRGYVTLVLVLLASTES